MQIDAKTDIEHATRATRDMRSDGGEGKIGEAALDAYDIQCASHIRRGIGKRAI